MAPAQKHFPAVLEMEAPEDLRGLARNGLREMAACALKARGLRKDGVFYPTGHGGCIARSRCSRSEEELGAILQNSQSSH